MTDKKKNRLWSDEEKRSICQQTTAPGASLAQVAQRYTVNANLIYKWCKDPRFAPVVPTPASEVDFIPVEVGECASVSAVDTALPRSGGLALCVRRVDITLSDGRRILVEGSTELVGVLGLVKGLMT